MKTQTLKELLLYNYRYWFGYTIVFGFILYFLGWRLTTIGPGLAPQEVVVATRHLTLQNIFELPLYPLHSLLQWISFSLFDVTTLSVRLPSILISLGVGFILYQLLKKWFGRPVALLTTALFVSADWFLFTARLGTGSIEFSFWLALAFLCFTKLLEHKQLWLLFFAVSLVGLLFTPFGVYGAITLLVSLFICRVFRQRTNEVKLLIKIPSLLVLLFGIGLIGFISYTNIDFLKNLLGLQPLPPPTSYLKNLLVNSSAIIAVLPDSNATISPTNIFFVRFFELIFITFGVTMLWKTRVNRLNMTVLVLSVVLFVVSGLNEGSRGASLLFVPAAIYMTAGIRHLIHRWQKTFPKNPYARLTAFVPLGILFIIVVWLHYASYFQLWANQSATHAAFSKDLRLVSDELNNAEYNNRKCYVESSESDFNALVSKNVTTCTVVFPGEELNTDLPDVLLVRPDSEALTNMDTANAKALVTADSTNSTKWLVVKNQTNN